MKNVLDGYKLPFMGGQQAISLSTPLEDVRRSVRFGLMASVATLSVFLIGGALAPLESATASHGMIVPSDYKKTVQHLEGGIIEAILVKDGEQVIAGQPLIRLSKVGASANQSIASTQYFTARVSEVRLTALQQGAMEMPLNEDIKGLIVINPELQDIWNNQQRMFAADRDAQRDMLTIFENQLAQLREEKEGLQARLKSSQAQLSLVNESLATERDLVARGLSTRPRLLSLQEQAEDMQGRVGEFSADIGKNEKSALEITAQISNEKHAFQSRIAEDLRQAHETSIELEKKLSSTSDVLNRTVITAPISGIVNDLKYHTIGGVIASGSTVMEIIPQDDMVLVDAEVLPRDISRVSIGQDAKIMFSTYKSRTTPMIMGKVVQVSADRIMPQASQESPAPGNGYYLTRVEIKKEELKKLANPITLTPGMPVEVMVIDGKRSLLSYYLKPFFDSFHKAFREE